MLPGTGLLVLLGLWAVRTVRGREERARLVEDLRRSREQVARLSHEAGLAAERERRAREVHAALAQGLTDVIGLVEAARSRADRSPATARTHLSLAGRTAEASLEKARGLAPPD
ncbi:histidine kinase [Streptomyces sp. MST-110588]|uniref:histidine kinase n=1 Tax=Streptomyces sp. MST-110588 TaxID=2833628 RepID=UPI001F5E0404|nr:histidine kinase [Streptomyces sp. MST-110588]